MESIRQKLANLKLLLPVDLHEFVKLIELPEDENCFEFSYFKTLANFFSLFAADNAKISVLGKKEHTCGYNQIMCQKFILSNPQNAGDIFDVVVKIYINGVGDHRFATILYDKEEFIIDRTDGGLLTVPVLV